MVRFALPKHQGPSLGVLVRCRGVSSQPYLPNKSSVAQMKALCKGFWDLPNQFVSLERFCRTAHGHAQEVLILPPQPDWPWWFVRAYLPNHARCVGRPWLDLKLFVSAFSFNRERPACSLGCRALFKNVPRKCLFWRFSGGVYAFLRQDGYFFVFYSTASLCSMLVSLAHMCCCSLSSSLEPTTQMQALQPLLQTG